jgi:hypothetical protein
MVVRLMDATTATRYFSSCPPIRYNGANLIHAAQLWAKDSRWPLKPK